MQLKQLFTDDDAVSPVIGVILMVAITVILAAVIGTFVLDLGQNAASQQASAGVSVDGSTATLTSLGPSTEGIKCAGVTTNSGNSGKWTTNVGQSITCDGTGEDSVVAYSTSGDVQNASVHTF